MPSPGTPCLLSLPAEILVQHILSRLNLSSLSSCSRTCKALYNIITSESSTLLTYIKELEIAGMVDNLDCSYTNIPLKTRLEALRDRETRWMGLNWEWRNQMQLPFNAPHTLVTNSSSGVVFLDPMLEDDEDGDQETAIYSCTLPFKNVAADIQWEEFVLGKQILHFDLSAEHDLLTCLTSSPIPSSPGSHSIQIHLIQNSTRHPHPLASSSILDFGAIHEKYDWTLVSVCGRNLAVVVDSAKGLFIYDWMSGINKGKILLPERRLGLAFLREDLLLNSSISHMSLDVYHIPTAISNPEAENIITPFVTYKLPEMDHTRFETVFIHCDDSPVPTSLSPSSPKCTPPPTRPFLSDPLSSILLIRVEIRSKFAREDDASHLFTFITHRQTLVNGVLGVFGPTTEQNWFNPDEIAIISWDNWGPQATRMFSLLMPTDTGAEFFEASMGTRYVRMWSGDLEVMDFGKYKVARHIHLGASSLPTNPGVRVNVCDAEHIHVYKNTVDVFLQEVSTSLPYISTKMHIKPPDVDDGGDEEDHAWGDISIDESRIFGHMSMAEDQMFDVLYFG